MLDSFIEAVRPRWERSEDSLVLISNAYWNQAEIDLVCILKSALVVIDFKAYSGSISVSENGPWRKGSVAIAGGAKQNPLIQIKHNKFAVMDWLRSRDLLKHCNLGHISGAVVFDGSIEVKNEGELPPQVSKWFSVVSMDTVGPFLNALASPGISIDNAEADRIVKSLSVPEYLWSPHQIVNISTNDEDPDSPGLREWPPTDSQKAVLKAIERFIIDDTSQIFSVSGMTSTGKSSLIPLLKELNLGSRSIVVLAPNNRFAAGLAARHGLNASGIYHHVYETNAKPTRVSSDKRSIESLPIRSDAQDRTDCIYVIDDAHLVTDTYFEPEPGKRFGTGCLVSDFLAYATLDSTTRKVVLLSDPYHITQARDADRLPSKECWERQRLTGQSLKLNQLIRRESEGAILDNAQRLVHCINEAAFAEFDLNIGKGLSVKNGRIAAAEAAEIIRSNPEEILLVAHSNSEVTKLNDWARSERFSQPAQPQAVSGDLLEIHSLLRNRDPLQERGSDLSPGDLVIVELAGRVQRIEQSLRGRSDPVIFHLQEVQLVGSDKGIFVLLDYLRSESKEIEADIPIAAKAWAEATENPEPVKARYGYAATAHHARSLRRARAVIALPKTMGRHNENYFRWLYTAITRAEQESVIVNWKPLHVFDKATLNRQSDDSKTTIPLGAGLTFDPDRPLSTDERELEVPEGLDSQSPAVKDTVAIWLSLLPVFEAMSLQILRVQGHPYQVHFTLSKGGRDSNELKVSYKGDKTISGIRADDQGLLLDVCEGISRRIQLDADQSRITTFLSRLPGLSELRLLSIKPSDYRILVVVGKESDGLAEVELNHDGEGMVSSIRILQHTDEQIVDRLVSAFESETAS